MVMQSVVMAQLFGGGGSGSNSTTGTFLSLIPFVLIFVIFYFMLILPQQKRKAAEGAAGGPEEGRQGGHGIGYLGHRDNLGKDTVTLQIADNTKIRIQRDHIARLRGVRKRIRIRRRGDRIKGYQTI